MVTVSNGTGPSLAVTSPIEINVGDAFDPKAGITVSDAEDNLTVNDVTYTGTYDVNKEGVYVLKYSVTDSDSNVATSTRILVVNDGNIVVGAKYIIAARDFTVNKPSVDTSDAKVKEFARAAAYKIEDGSAATVNIDSLGGYKAAKGEYSITFSVDEEPATTKVIKATVLDKGIVVEGEIYDIGANNITVGKEDAKAMIADDAKLIDATAAEAWIKNKYSEKGTVEVSDKAKLKAEVGSYEVTFNVAEELATKATVTITVVDKDVVVEGEEYAIGANNVVLGIKDAEAITDNNELISKAQASSWKKEAPAVAAGTVQLESTTFKAAEGKYNATFNVKEEVATKVSVVIEVRAEDHVAVGDKYMIVGNDFTINTTEAATITEAQIIEKAAASAWLKDNEASKGTVKVTANTVETAPGVYNVELYVNEEPATKITIKVTVSDGQAPILKVTTPVEIEVGGTFDEKAGITVSDDTDDLKVSDVTMSGTYDVNKEGVYVLTYSVTDSDNNTATAKRLLVVNDGSIFVGAKYVIEAYDFVISKADVDASEAAVKAATKAKAYKIEDASAGTVNITDLGGYTAAKGEYTIAFNVAEEPATTISAVATVLDKKIEEGSLYSIAAKDTTVGIEDAKALLSDNAKLISATQAESWLNGSYATKAGVEVTDKAKLKAEVGSYEVTFNVTEEPATKVTVTITVKDKDVVVTGNEYAIGANHITVGIEDAKALLSDDAKLVDATAAEAWKVEDGSFAIAQVLDKANLKAEAGAYEVTFNVKEEPATKVTVTITVKDKDVVVEGSTYAIGANHITVGKADAQAMIDDNAKLISATAAEAWLKANPAEAGTVEVFDKAALKAEAGAYEVTFNVTEEPATKVTVTITVKDKDVVVEGNTYAIGANHITIGKAQAEQMIADNAKLISATAAEAWQKENPTTAGTVEVLDKTNLKAEDGTYEVTFNVKEEPATQVTIKVTVKDKDVIVEGSTYVIGANHITIGKTQAKDMIADNAKLISATAAEAWQKENAAVAGTVLVLDKANLKAEAGAYEVTFNV
ncbi:DUF5011 domain-containing protein, partial [Erysipelotrichaceae bacterium OttesenSCG-928-M19]|nr:DUF5011 domain-containing protein [Erysipelotrichaceae bacterium OttesenSCG-928-M19]